MSTLIPIQHHRRLQAAFTPAPLQQQFHVPDDSLCVIGPKLPNHSIRGPLSLVVRVRYPTWAIASTMPRELKNWLVIVVISCNLSAAANFYTLTDGLMRKTTHNRNQHLPSAGCIAS